MNHLLSFIPSQIFPIMALIGTYCFILAYEKQHVIERVLKNGIETEGTVIEIRHDPSNPSGQEVAPVVDFNTPNGSHRHYSTTYTATNTYHVGQKVRIWYKFYKSKRDVALPDEKPGNLPKTLFRWGIVLCLLSYPEIIRRLSTML